MKKLSVVSAVIALGLSSVGFAGGLPEEMPVAPVAISSSDTGTGVYVGLAGGYGMTNWKNKEKDGNRGIYDMSKDNGAVSRVFVGFDLNRYFAIETGYSYFFNKAKVSISGTDICDVKTQAFDLMGKIKAPVVDGFDLYAKIGGNYLMSNVDSKVAGVNYDNVRNFNLGFGAGADYAITPNIIANVEWLRFNGKAKVKSDKYQPSADAFMVGLRYKFDL